MFGKIMTLPFMWGNLWKGKFDMFIGWEGVPIIIDQNHDYTL